MNKDQFKGNWNQLKGELKKNRESCLMMKLLKSKEITISLKGELKNFMEIRRGE